MRDLTRLDNGARTGCTASGLLNVHNLMLLSCKTRDSNPQIETFEVQDLLHLFLDVTYIAHDAAVTPDPGARIVLPAIQLCEFQLQRPCWSSSASSALWRLLLLPCAPSSAPVAGHSTHIRPSSIAKHWCSLGNAFNMLCRSLLMRSSRIKIACMHTAHAGADRIP